MVSREVLDSKLSAIPGGGVEHKSGHGSSRRGSAHSRKKEEKKKKRKKKEKKKKKYTIYYITLYSAVIPDRILLRIRF